MRFKFLVPSFIALFFLLGCGEETIPKPKAQLRLEYPKSNSKVFTGPYFSFEQNTMARIRDQRSSSFTLSYPDLKGAIYITYKPVEGNLRDLLSDAQKLSYEHVARADNILEQRFENTEDAVYGMFYEVKGNAASQAQFYATDSINHFITGSLYFYAKPNYDSIYPAAVYLQKDVRRILETLKWKP